MSYTKKDYEIFDRIVNKTLINIYSKAKETNRIYFSEVVSDSIPDWCVLKIAHIAQQFWGFRIYTNLNPFANWYLSKKLKIYPKIKTCLKEAEDTIKITELQKFIVNSEDRLIDIYSDIYSEYYSRKD